MRELRIAEGSWIAARCTARDELLSDDELAAYKDTSDAAARFESLRLACDLLTPARFTSRSMAEVRCRERTSIEEGFQMLKRFEIVRTNRRRTNRTKQQLWRTSIETARGKQLKNAARAASVDDSPSYDAYRPREFGNQR